MTFADKRFVLKSLVAATALAGLCGTALAQEAPKSIRIGWAIAKTGVNAGGTSATTAPNYKLWVKEINDAGGIMLKAYNKRVPIEVIEYDDRSSTEEAVLGWPNGTLAWRIASRPMPAPRSTRPG